MKNKRGFTQTIILIVVIVATLAYFNVDVKSFFENPGIQKVTALLVGAWVNYVWPLFQYLWSGVVTIFS